MSAKKYFEKAHREQSKHGHKKLGYICAHINPNRTLQTSQDVTVVITTKTTFSKTKISDINLLTINDPVKVEEALNEIVLIGKEYGLGKRGNGIDICEFLEHQLPHYPDFNRVPPI